MKTQNVISAISMGTIILFIIGLYNGYPLVYSDTGIYIYSGFDKFIPSGRPIIYGLFLRYSSLGFSTWFVILFQNAMTAFIILEVLLLFKFKTKYLTLIYFSILLFLVLTTGIGWYSNQLMPDFFAPLIPLIIFILHKRKQLFDFSGIFLLLFLILSMTSHFSHILLGSTLMVFIIVSRLLVKLLNDIAFKRILIITGFVFSSWFIIPLVNYIVQKEFVLSKNSHVYLMAHLNDTGILKKFLNENCSDPEFTNYNLCAAKDSLPSNLASFLWSNQILDFPDGWTNSKDEYDKIITATLSRPKYLLLNIYKSLTYGFIQLTRNNIGQGLSVYNKGSAPYGQIRWRFNDELNNYLNSLQNRWKGVNLNLEMVNSVQLVLIIFSLFMLILIFTSSLKVKIDSATKMLLLFIIVSIIFNSFITAGLNSPCERFQARVIWLLPFSIIIVVLKNYSLLFKTFYNNVSKK